MGLYRNNEARLRRREQGSEGHYAAQEDSREALAVAARRKRPAFAKSALGRPQQAWELLWREYVTALRGKKHALAERLKRQIDGFDRNYLKLRGKR